MDEDAAASPKGSPDPRTWLRQELDGWLADRLITGSQARKLLQRYGLADDGCAREADTRHAGRLIAVLGSILVGIGVLLIVGANWEEIPHLLRLVLLLGSIGVCYRLGYELAYERRTAVAGGTALLLLGSLLYGSSIFLIAQMYHVGGHGGEQQGLIYWVAGVLPLAYVLRSRLQLGLALVLAELWFCLELGELHWTSGEGVLSALLASGCLIFVGGLYHRRSNAPEGFAEVYTGLAAPVVLVALYGLSFQDAWGSYSYDPIPEPQVWFWLAPVLLAAGVGALLLLSRHGRSDRVTAAEAAAVLGLTVVAGAVVAHVAVGAGLGGEGHHLWPAVLSNLLLLSAEVGLVAVGVQRGRAGLINLGLTFFGLHVVTRYFDIFGDLLPGGLMFVGAGVLLLLGGIALDRGRRRLVAAAREIRP